MKWFEFQVGLYVEAETEDEAMRKLSTLMTVADELDPEADAQCEMVGTWDEGGAPNRPKEER